MLRCQCAFELKFQTSPLLQFVNVTHSIYRSFKQASTHAVEERFNLSEGCHPVITFFAAHLGQATHPGGSFQLVDARFRSAERIAVHETGRDASKKRTEPVNLEIELIISKSFFCISCAFRCSKFRPRVDKGSSLNSEPSSLDT